MAHCRALYHFFKKKPEERIDQGKRIDDDIVSEDFDFPALNVYGKNSDELVARFNKDMLHLTYTRLERTPKTKPWPIDRLTPPVETRAKEFIDHILNRYKAPIPDGERTLWEKLKADVEKGAPLEQNTSNVAALYSWTIEATRCSRRIP
jgi:hypothetical protein